MEEKYKRVLYRAWSLRNQFNGEWDSYYFPKLAKAIDIAFKEDRYPEELMPGSVKAACTKAGGRRGKGK